MEVVVAFAIGFVGAVIGACASALVLFYHIPKEPENVPQLNVVATEPKQERVSVFAVSDEHPRPRTIFHRWWLGES